MKRYKIFPFHYIFLEKITDDEQKVTDNERKNVRKQRCDILCTWKVIPEIKAADSSDIRRRRTEEKFEEDEKMKGRKAKKVWRGLTAVTASLMAITIGGTAIATANGSWINTFLGTTNYKTVEKGNGEETDTTYFDSEFSSLEELVSAKEELAEQISEEGSVLLKNNNDALPLNKESESITLWGMNSHTPTLGGMIGSPSAVDSEHGQVAYGIEEALEEKGFMLNQSMIDFYAGDEAMAYARLGFGATGHGLSPAFGMSYENPASYQVGEVPADLYTEDLLASADDTTAVVVISRDNSEAADYHPDMVNGTSGDSFERPLALSDYEQDMISLAKQHSTKVVVLINSDNPVEIESLKQDEEIDAILWTGLPGISGFLGVADVLSGDENPSGHLSDTYAVNTTSTPAMVNFGVYTYTNNSQAGAEAELTETDKADWYVVESEGIYSGNKYYETRYEDTVLGRGNADASEGSSTGNTWDYTDEVSYPFGYGLSYTTFDQTLNSVNVEIGGTGTAEVTVTNTGDTAGKSVVQLYVQAPYTENGIEKASVQLIGFGKTDVLEPGESVTVTVEFDPQYMASYDEEAVKENGTQGAWVLEEGDYYFAIGNGAHEALNNILAQKTGSQDGLETITDAEVINPENATIWHMDSTDIETYSEGVENALQDCDINSYIEDAVEYTTRSDWTKGWEPVTSLTPTEEMMAGLTNSKTELTENGDGVQWGVDSGLALIDFMQTDEDGNFAGVIPLDDPMWDALVDQITLDEAITFIEKAGTDFESIPSINLPKTYANDGPVGFAYDQVAGYLTRWTEADSDRPTYVSAEDEYATYAMNSMPTEPVVASTWSKELAEREGELLGEDGLWSKESTIMAPGLNIHRNAYCARNHEYYSEDAMLTNYMGTAICKGGQSKGLMMEPKHLAFNHQETNRSGISTFFSEQAGRENELRAFQGAMESNYADGVMTGFNRIGTDFSGGDAGLLTQIVRNEWGYEGWLVTDLINGADYMNWRDIVFAGGGAPLTETAYDDSEIGWMSDAKAEIEKDTEFQQQMKLGIKYYLYNFAASNAMNGLSNTTELVYVNTWWQIALYAAIGVTAVLTAGSLVMYIRASRKKGE